MKRWTHTEKWQDPWFSELSPDAKLVFYYLCDSCNNAGFLEEHFKKMAWDTGYDIEHLKTAVLPELTQGREGEDGEKFSVIVHKGWIFLPNYIRNQGNYPVNPANRAHTQIIGLMKDQAIRFHSVPAYREIKDQIDLAMKDQSESSTPDKGIGTASREDLRQAVKDWDAIRVKCMSNLNDIFRTNPDLREAFMKWWDHRFSIGDPLELPMWNELQSQARNYTPTVILEAISYSIGQGIKTINWQMAKRAVEEKGVNTSTAPKEKLKMEEPAGWEEAYGKAFPQSGNS